MTTLQITDLPIDAVRPHPQNVRRELRGIDELADSIKAEGLHQPIIVAPEGDQHVVVMGNSRHAACLKLGWDTIPCIVRDDLDTEEKVLSAMLAENCSRNYLTVTEEGDAFQRLLDLDLSAAAVGKRAGRSRKQVTERVTIASQSERIRRAVDDKQLTIGHALALAEFTDDHELYARIEGAVGTPRFEYELERAAAIRRHTKVGEDLRAEARALGFVEATEKELSALHEPVGGFRLERIWGTGTPDPATDGQGRFTITSANIEHWAPSIRYYRLVPVAAEASDDASESAASPAPLTSEQRAEREAAETRAAVAEAESQERKTAMLRRRAWLRDLWDRTDASDPRSAELLLVAALDVDDYAWEPLTELGTIIAHDGSDNPPRLEAGDPRLDYSEWPTLRLAFATWWCRWGYLGELELSLYQPNYWEPVTVRYLEFLREQFGYELSDIEEALLDTYNASADGGDD